MRTGTLPPADALGDVRISLDMEEAPQKTATAKEAPASNKVRNSSTCPTLSRRVGAPSFAGSAAH